MSILDLVPPGYSSPVECHGEVHELGWCGAGDGLRATAHDLTDEDVLRALGGERPPCVELAARWHDYRLEPLLLVAMLTGDADLLARQTFATTGPPIRVTGRSGLYLLVEPLVELAAPLRTVLAAEAAIAYSATTLLRTGAPDNTSAVRAAVRAQLQAAATSAFGRSEVDVRQVWVTDDADDPVLFVRSRRDGELVLAGKVPVRWAALAALGLAVIDGSRLVLDAVVGRGGGEVRMVGYSFRRRDPDLTPFALDLGATTVEQRIRARLG